MNDYAMHGHLGLDLDFLTGRTHSVVLEPLITTNTHPVHPQQLSRSTRVALYKQHVLKITYTFSLKGMVPYFGQIGTIHAHSFS